MNFVLPTERACITGDDRRLCEAVPPGIKKAAAHDFPVRLSQIRYRQQLSATTLSSLAGLNPNTVWSLEETVDAPRISTVERLAAALGVPPGWLAYGVEGTEPLRKRRPRGLVAPADPEPSDIWRQYRGQHEHCAARVRLAREKSGRSMRELAREAEISRQTWSNTESGATVPRLDSLEQMARVLKVAPAWLAYGYEDEPRH